MAFVRWLLLPLLASLSLCSAQVSVVDLVHPLVGTAAEGQTFPATGVPFAMTNWTPQTRDGEIKCVAPYYYADTRIQGFRASHFLSGSCTQDYGSFTIMPGSGPLRLLAAERGSSFTHAQESARPYLYSVDLTDYGVHADITGTKRSGFMRLRFARGGASWIALQANVRAKPTGDRNLSIDVERNEVSGQNAVTRLYAGDGQPAGFSGYFVAQFDHPFRASGAWDPGGAAGDGKHAGAHLSFQLRPGEVVLVRIGTSFTSVEEARKNLHAEIPGWNFSQTVAQAKAAWQQALGKIAVAGSAPERTVFYTAMYHSMLLPRTLSDSDGSYPRFGGGTSVETARGFTYYDDFSIWDTFRTLHPMLTILDPARERDMVVSLIAKGTQGGFLPIFPAWNSYTSEMVGDHADAIIVDAYAKGIRGFDVEAAYRLMRRNALESPSPSDYADGRGRRALTSYLQYGYIPLEDHVLNAFHKDEQVSRTLEYAYDDFLVSRMAAAMGKQEDATLFAKHGGNWRNVIDPATGFARGRHADGSWITPFEPADKASYITEGLPFQYTFFVPQDIPGLIQHLGGREAFVAKLDTLFSKGYYDQGNEPSHHIAYLYNFAGAAAKTQQHVRELLDTQYRDRIDGLSGNDDAGQMSAWYAMSALGLYPETPGLPEYELSTPRFGNITVHLPRGRTLRILAPGTETGKRYIRSVQWNGKSLLGHTISHKKLVEGGTLIYTLSDAPSTNWPLAGH